MEKDLLEIISYVKSYLYYQEFLGIKGIPRTSGILEVRGIPSKDVSVERVRVRNPAVTLYGHRHEEPEGLTLEDIKREIVNCQRCDLSTTRTQIVFGVGKEDADLLLIGEAPGEEEDLKGEPFVGMAGQLLTRILKSIGFDRKDVYITNVVKCRPPHNRNPQHEEIKACEPYLVKQISIIKPKIICALGAFAAQTLLKTGEKISLLRGRFYNYQGTKLMPTYHPAFLLRYPSMKKPLWEDMQKIKREMENLSL